MSFHRYLIALLTSTLLTAATALAAPPGVSVGVGAHGNVGIGAPPVGVPSAHVPPLTIPPVNVPKPQTNVPPANANARAGDADRAAALLRQFQHRPERRGGDGLVRDLADDDRAFGRSGEAI